MHLQVRDESGASAVELALIVPVFLLLIMGAIDLGYAVVISNGASEAARDGARAAILLATPVQATPSSANVPTPTPYAVLASGAQQAVATAARDKAGTILGANPTVVATARWTDQDSGPYVQVVVTTSYQPVSGRLLGISNIPIQSSSTMYVP